MHLSVAYEFYHVACFIALVFYVLTFMCRSIFFSRYFEGVILRPQWDFKPTFLIENKDCNNNNNNNSCIDVIKPSMLQQTGA